MKIKSLVYLALFGLALANDPPADPTGDPTGDPSSDPPIEEPAEPKVQQLPVDTVEVEDCSIIEDAEAKVACEAKPIPWYHNG